MAWNISERFPSWGETGEFPADGFFYEGGDQVNEKHLDALWNGINGFEEDVQAAFNDIDSNADGVVDETDTVAAGGNLKGDLNAVGGETIWDESLGYIPQSRFENDDLTITAGDGLKGGGLTALGGSTTLNIEPSDFAGDGVKDDGTDNIAVEPADFAGTGLIDDGADNLAVGDQPNITFVDSDADGSQFSITEDGTTGDLEVRHGGLVRHNFAQNGDVSIEGELTEGAAL